MGVILFASTGAIVQAAPTTTLSSIAKNYPGAKILKVVHYQQRYVMIEYQYPGAAYFYDLYDLSTGAKYSLGSAPWYATLNKIMSPNDFVFDSTGVYSEVPQNVFPFTIEFTRKNTNSEFGMTEYPKYLSVNQSFTFQYGKQEELTSYSFTQDGIKFQFGPLKNDPHGGYYAGSTWIPSTHISYNRPSNQLIVQFTKTLIGPGFSVTNDPAGYISSIHMQSSAQGGTSLVLQLKPGTQYYNAKVTWKDSQHNVPELQLSFLPKNVTFEPGVVIFHDVTGGQVDDFLAPIWSDSTSKSNPAPQSPSGESSASTPNHAATMAANSNGETFAPQLMSEIEQVAQRDQRIFQVYIPTGGFSMIKNPGLDGWNSGAIEFGLDIAEKTTRSPDYHITEMPYGGPWDMSSLTRLGDFNGVAVYEHKFGSSTILYYFRIGFTSFSITASTMLPKQQIVFPKQLLTHLVRYAAQGLAMPSAVKWIGHHQTLNFEVPNADAKNGEIWRVIKDPGGLPAVQVSLKGKLMLLLSVPAINQKKTVQYILIGGQTYKVSHIIVHSDNKSATVTLIKQTG